MMTGTGQAAAWLPPEMPGAPQVAAYAWRRGGKRWRADRSGFETGRAVPRLGRRQGLLPKGIQYMADESSCVAMDNCWYFSNQKLLLPAPCPALPPAFATLRLLKDWGNPTATGGKRFLVC